MKKYISVLLCLAMILSLALPVGTAFAAEGSTSVTVIADHAAAGVDVTSPITKDGWGEPTIHVDKNSSNVTLESLTGADPGQVEMDLYFRWNKDYLYIGVVSPDDRPTGSGNFWDGDGIQFKITAPDGKPVDVCVTLAKDGSVMTYSDAYDSNYPAVDWASSLSFVDGKMNLALAIPQEALGLTKKDVKAGLKYTFNLIRISGVDDTEAGIYAGWLAWGKYFAAYCKDCSGDNYVVLGAAEEETVSGAVKAKKVYSTLDVTAPISAEMWGEPTIHVDKNSSNVTLESLTGAADPGQVEMDLYFRWDKNYLYIGVVSPDDRPTGSDNFWDGDGIQFGITAPDGKPVDVCVTLAKDGSVMTYSDAYDSNYPAVDWASSLSFVDGNMNLALAIPQEALGLTNKDVKAGLAYKFNLLRISGVDDSEAGIYAGWLAWGKYFDDGRGFCANCTGDNYIVLVNETVAQPNVVEAKKVVSAPDLSGKIAKKTWGEPVIHVTKDTYNTCIDNYNNNNPLVPEDVSMDLYFNWDADYFYIGVVSEDKEFVGHGEFYEGDGIQFKLKANGGAYIDMCITLDEAGNAMVYSNAYGSYDAVDWTAYCKIVDGVLNVSVAVPQSVLGLTAKDIKAGLVYDMSLIRIDGNKGDGYAGWLAWGEYFVNHPSYCIPNHGDNHIVLTNAIADQANVYKATKITAAPMIWGAPNNAINPATWGKPTVSVSKNSYNTVLYGHEGAQPEDTTMDLYFRYDAQYIYIGMASPDSDPTGNDTPWEGDGIQFAIAANKNVNRFADPNIYITLSPDNTTIIAGLENTSAYKYNGGYYDGKLYTMVAVPFADLGLTEADIKAGLPLHVNALRISGTDSTAYAGWLAWGPFFEANHAYNPGLSEDNIVVLSDEYEDQGVVVPANKTGVAPDFKAGIIDKAIWGEPGISVTKDSFNSSLYALVGSYAEDTNMDIYAMWDDKNLYFGMASKDSDLVGSDEAWTGDGIQFDIMANSTSVSRADSTGICLTFRPDGSTPQILIENNDILADLDAKGQLQYSTKYADGTVYCMIALPLDALGMVPADIKDGAVLAFDILRISGTSEKDGSEYAGWLASGPFFGAGHEYNINGLVHDLIRLVDPNAGEDDEPEEEPFVSIIQKLGDAASTSKYLTNSGSKILTTADGVYTLNLAAADLLTNKGVSIYNVFELSQIKDGVATNLAYAYTYAGVPDLFADQNGMIWVSGGASLYDVKALSNQYDNYKEKAEKAILNVWFYANGTMNGIGTQKTFSVSSKKGYDYLVSVMEGDTIYQAFAGETEEGTVVEIFKFDVATRSWAADSKVIKLSAKPTFVKAYADNGMNFIYGSNKGTFKVVDGEEVKITSGALKTAYALGDDIMVVYEDEGKLYITAASSVVAKVAKDASAESTESTINVYYDGAISMKAVDVVNWTKVAHLDKDSANASLDKHDEYYGIDYDAPVEEVSMDVYTAYDNENFYIGFVSEDNNFAGDDRRWVGEGMQLIFENVDKDLHFGTTLAGNGTDVQYYDYGTAAAAYDLKFVDGKVYATMAVKLSDIGVEAKGGEQVTFKLMRTCGMQECGQAGWLVWGWADTHDNYYQNCTSYITATFADKPEGESDDAQTIKPVELPVGADMDITVENIDGKYVLVAMSESELATAHIFTSEDGMNFAEAKSVQIDDSVNPLTTVNVGKDTNGSLAVAFGGMRGKTFNQYYAELSLAD